MKFDYEHIIQQLKDATDAGLEDIKENGLGTARTNHAELNQYQRSPKDMVLTYRNIRAASDSYDQ